MKNLSLFSNLILACMLVTCLPMFNFAQDANKMSGIKADEVWPVIKQVIKQKNLQVEAFDESKGTLISSYEEYSAGLIKNRAKYNFDFKNGELTVTLLDKQTLSTSGWAAAIIPSKKADEKLVAAMVENAKTLFADPALIAKLKGASGENAPAGKSMAKEVRNNVKTSVIQSKPLIPSAAGAKQVKFQPDDEYLFSEGLCALKKNELWGFIDTTGNWVIDAQYFEWGGDYPSFSSGICLVGIKSPDGYGNIPIYLDKKGNQLFKNQVFANASPFHNGVALVEKKTGPGRPNAFSLINTQGVAIPGAIVPTMKSIFFEFPPYHDGLTKMWDKKLDGYGFIDAKGKWVIMPDSKWNEVGEFGNGRAQVQNKTNFYWGYIDKKGKTVIPYDYKAKPGVFSCGRAMVANESRQIGYIDVTGKLVLDFNYTTPAFDFHNGYAVVTIDDNVITRAIIDTTGKVIKILNKNENVMVNSDGNVTYTGKIEGGDYVGVVAPDGTEIIPLSEYTTIKAFGNNLAYVEYYDGSGSDTKTISGFINRKGEMVIVRQP